MSTAGPAAVIDCGTNTTRLLITDGGDLDVRLQRVTGLGRGLQATGSLGAAGIDRVLAALTDFRAELDRHGVERVRAIATSAARDALTAITS